MDLSETRILLIVAAKLSENLSRLKGKGSSATIISRGLVDPKTYPNRSTPKGNQVNIPEPWKYVRRREALFRTFLARSSTEMCLTVQACGVP